MRHRKESSTFGRSKAHRKALMASMACGLISEKRITTTLPRAKAARSVVEKMVTLAKQDTIAARRRAFAVLHRKEIVHVLFNEIAPKCQDRAGGYIRIVKLGRRRGDNSPMAIMEWVSIGYLDKKKKRAAKEKTVKEKTAKETPVSDK